MSEKRTNSLVEPFEEMARIGFVGEQKEFEVYVRTDDLEHVPHIHIRDTATKGKDFETCVELQTNRYCRHGHYKDVMDNKLVDDFYEFMCANPGNPYFNMHYESAIAMWNMNNECAKMEPQLDVDGKLIVPDYRKLKGTIADFAKMTDSPEFYGDYTRLNPVDCKSPYDIMTTQSTMLTAFRKGLRRIDEKGINCILQHGQQGFIIVSASRNEIFSDNPSNDLTPQYEKWCETQDCEVADKNNMDLWLMSRNKAKDTELLQRLKASKYAYTPVYSVVNSSQYSVGDIFAPSYIVYCHGREMDNSRFDFHVLYEFGRELAEEYKQDGIYVSKPTEAVIYVDGNGDKTYPTDSKNVLINRYTEEYFAKINRKKETTNDYSVKSVQGCVEATPQRSTVDIQFESLYRKAGPANYGDRVRRGQSGEVFIGE